MIQYNIDPVQCWFNGQIAEISDNLSHFNELTGNYVIGIVSYFIWNCI